VRVRFGALPGQTALRPTVSIAFPDSPGVTTVALVDSGAMANRFHPQWAEHLGIDLSTGPVERVTIANGTYLANVHHIRLQVGQWTWTAPVAFPQNWNHPHEVLGLRGFFDEFAVRIVARDNYLALIHR